MNNILYAILIHIFMEIIYFKFIQLCLKYSVDLNNHKIGYPLVLFYMIIFILCNIYNSKTFDTWILPAIIFLSLKTIIWYRM